MATLTIRDLDDTLKQSLRVRAAHRNHSMEEEVRQILRAALRENAGPEVGLVERVRARFAEFGGVELELAPREPMRTPPQFGARSTNAESRPASSSLRSAASRVQK